MYFDTKFDRRETKYPRNFEIDDNLYVELERYTKIYDASISTLINACIQNLVQHILKTQSIPYYTPEKTPLNVVHTIRVRESNIKDLEYLKQKYGISLFRLVNMAIHFTIHQEDDPV